MKARNPKFLATALAAFAVLLPTLVSAQSSDGVKSENYIAGATNTPSLVPTYLNNIMYWDDNPSAFGGLCWASCTVDIFAYWDRNPYNGIKYWNLIDNGTAPLLQASLPTAPGHDEANVKAAISFLAHEYYTLGNYDEKALIEKFANQTNGLAFTATYYGPVSSTADRTTLLGIIKGEIDAGRPTGIGSWGTYFGGAHQIPVMGYKEMSNTVNSTVYIHRNTGGTQSEYANFYASSWGNLDMDQIVPGGTPVDEYEPRGDNSSATTVSLNPDHVYDFRQTHNFSFAGDTDWVRLSAVTGRQYTISTGSLGTGCDTILTLFQSDGVTQIAQDDDGGTEARASKIIWNCGTAGTYLMRVTDKAGGSGHAANYDLKVTYGTAVNGAPTNILLSGSSVAENLPAGTQVGSFSTQDPDAGNTFTYTLASGSGSTDNGSFTISGSNLLTSASFNYEVKSNYSIRVQSMDQGGLSTQKVFAINVTDVNEMPGSIQLSGGSVAENLPGGTQAGSFSTQNSGVGSTFTYTLVSGSGSTDNGSFTISGSNLLTSASFNYEVKSNYSIRVQSTEQGGLSTQTVFAINVTDVNETPTNILLSGSSVAENLPAGTQVGSFSTQDPDAGNTFTYTLASGSGSTDNGSFTISGSNLLTSASFNYEAKSNYSIRVQSTDQGGLSAQTVFVVNVADVNETPAVPTIVNPGSRNATVGVAFNLWLDIQSASTPSVTVSGLPSGLKYSSATRVISGVPTKAVTNKVVTIRAKNSQGEATQTFQMTVVPLPPWAWGAFNGWYKEGREAVGVATMAVTSQGKVSGKCLTGGLSFTFKATSYAAGGNVNDGFSFTANAAAGELSVPVVVTVKPSFTAGGPASLGVAEGQLYGITSTVAPGKCYRNVWLDADMKTVATNLDGYYTATLPGDGGFGSGYLGLTVKKGTVKAAGKLADGTAVSMSGTMVLDESNRCFVVLYNAPKAYQGGSFFGMVEFVGETEPGAPVVLHPKDGAAFVWNNYDPKATGVYEEEFRRDMWLVGGWYDKLGNLYAYYEGKELSVGVAGPVPEILVGDTRYESVWWDPSGRPLSVVTNALGVMTGIKAEKVAAPVRDGADWLYDPDTNTVGLVFSLTRPTGVFKGSFKAWFDYGTTHTSKSIPFSGILTPEREDMDDGIEGRGYYLWPDKAQYINAQDNVVSYPFKWSCDFKIQSEQ